MGGPSIYHYINGEANNSVGLGEGGWNATAILSMVSAACWGFVRGLVFYMSISRCDKSCKLLYEGCLLF